MSPSADVLNRLGVECKLRGDDEGARLHYMAALRTDLGFLPALANVGEALAGEHRRHAALTCLRRVVASAPFDATQLMNLGIILMQMERFEEAQDVMARACNMAPDVPQMWHNMALLHHRMGEFSTAITFMRQVRLLGKTGPEVDNDLAHMLLAEGKDLQEALRVYESRWWSESMLHLPPWDYHVPEWQGERLDGKRILVHAEQGFGDTIMTARFVQGLGLTGVAEVVFCVPEALRIWFKHQEWPKIRVIAMEGLTAEDFVGVDYHSPLYSTMRWMGIEWKDIKPLKLVPPKIKCEGVDDRFFNIGICWASGRRGTMMDWRRRYAPLELWLPFADNPKIKLWSLTKGEEYSEELEALGADALVEDHTREFRDWADTAAVIAKLDLVISVDTAVAHVSAALSRPTWMLEPYSRCWRWQHLPSGLPWYDTMQVYQQSQPGDWEGPIERCWEELDELVARPTVPCWVGYTPQRSAGYGFAD